MSLYLTETIGFLDFRNMVSFSMMETGGSWLWVEKNRKF